MILARGKKMTNDEWIIAHDMYLTPQDDPDGDKNDEVDYEVLYYHRSRSLCFQPHPEYGDVPGCTDYFFNLITKYYPQHSLSREPK